MISTFLCILLLRLIVAQTVTNDDLPVVTKVTPNAGSLGGGMKLTVQGRNFASDQSEGSNEVILTNRISEIKCEVFVLDSTTHQIVCYTLRGMEVDVTYWVKVKVNGEKIPDERLCNNQPYGDDCSFTPRWWNTPVARAIEPQTGMLGDDLLVKISGLTVTTRFGSGEDISANGREEKLVRVYGPGTVCELKDGDDFYGLWVAADSFEGYMICKPTGSYVGCANMTFMVEAPFGRSIAAGDQLFASSTGQLCMIQYYTDVSSVSPAVGSTEGDLTVRITGSYYERGGINSTYNPTRVYIGGTVCEITHVEKNEYIECTVAKQPDNLPSKFSGGRGVDVEIWEDEELADLDALEAAAVSSNIKHFDSAKFSGDDINAKQTRLIGRFIPPKSGYYAFLVKATYRARLSIDGVAQATSTGDWASGGRLKLVKDQPYQLMVAAMGPASNPGASSDTPPTVEAQARFFDEDKFTSDWTGNAIQEEQIIRISSTPTQDVQVLSFSQGTSQSWEAQKQRICIEGATFDISIGMFGAFTGIVAVDDATKVEEALNNVPYIDKDLENFSVEQIDEQCVEVTINSPRGDFPKFVVNGEDIIADVSITTHGVPDNDFVSLVIGGRPSIPFLISELTEAKLHAAANSMFETTCPDVFSKGNSIFESFEGTPSGYRYGHVVNEIESFCGRQSIKNPRKIYPIGSDDDDISLKAMLDFHVCFAYSGLTNASFVYKYRDSTVDKNIHWQNIDVVPLQEASEGNLWSYSCVSPYDTIDGGDLIEAKLEGVFVENFYVDAVYFGPKATFSSPGRIAEQRLRPASPGRLTEQVLIDHADVNYDDGTGEYEVTLYPLDCRYDFELFELLNKEGDSPTGESGSTTLSGGSAMMSVTRIQTASPPVQGSLRVSWMGQTSASFDTTNTVEQIRNFLQGIPTIGLLRVKESEDSTCANKDLHVTFTSRAGDQETMLLSHKEIRAPPSGDVEIVDYRDGYLRFNPILGDLLRTEKDTPQVEVFINDVPSYCSGDCTFQWSADATPSVDLLDKNSGASGDVLVITGTKFSATPGDNSVLVGDVPCGVTASTTTSITCTLGEGSGSNQAVQVTVAGNGRAAGSQTFTYIWEMTDFEPKSGSYGGGLTLTVSGYGFPSTATVHVDDVLCPTIELISTEITCTVPASVEPPSSGIRDVAVEVRVPTTTTVRKRRDISMTFTFDTSLTGIITLITGPQILSVVGGDQFSVTGRQFGSDVEIVFEDGNEFVSVESTRSSGIDGEDTVTFESPSNLMPGPVKLCVNIDGHGCAIVEGSNAPPFLNCQLSVSSILPTHGSQYGGTVITIRGGYFGTVPANVDVTVGAHICVVSSVTNDQILCQIAKTARKKVITNGGKHGYDKYYAWDDDNAHIELGDTIRWTWTVPEFITYNRYRVIETESESSETLIEGGIDSGPGTLTGAFEHTFTKPGVHYFWSGYVDPNGLRYFRGRVTVNERASTAKQIVVKVMGWEAEYIDSRSSNPANSDSCSVTSAKSSCSDPIPVAPVSNEFKFHFIFSSCFTPMVTKMMITAPVAGNEQAVTTSRHITVVGEGFAAQSCAVDAMLGEGEQECSCQTISSSETRAVFRPEDECTMPAVAVPKALSVLVKGRGYALVQAGKLALLPSIREISPNRGSKFGNTFVQIGGTGLKDVTSVMFNNIPAVPFEAVSDILIECYSPNAQTGPVTVAKGNFPGVCDDADDGRCYFHYDVDLTPKVSDVVPATISSFDSDGHTLTFTGTKFGTTPADVTVFVGDVECTITSLSDTSIECTVQGLPAGENNIYMTVEGYGNAQAPQKITGTPDISSLSESSGSQYGGHRLVITGHGFHSEGTTVMIGSSPCEVIDVTVSSLTCVTPLHEVGIEDLVVSVPVESAVFPIKTYEFKSVLDGVDVSPKEGTAGNTVTISGSGFGTDSAIVSIKFDDSECIIDADSFSTTAFTCELGSHAVGPVLGQVLVNNVGLSNTFDFTYEVALTSVTPNTGDAKGKQRVTISGAGFTADMKVTFGEAPCYLDPTHTTTPSEIVCITPPGATGTCDINIISGEVVETLPGGYTFEEDHSPIIGSVMPPRAGTGGGARITISGSGFGTDSSAVTVTLEGSDCTIDTVSFSDTEIQCLIPAQSGTVETEVRVTLGQRTAVEEKPGAAKFWYIDEWSSEFTWNGPVPAEGELVVVQAGHVLLLDEDTPVLAQLLILGGVVIFDCSKPVELRAKYIFITNGGRLQIGTEDEPCLTKATITLYGHQREKELPIFGAKVLALHNGSLELHGKPIPTTWTTLSETALKDAWEIVVPWGHTVNWAPGNEIIIATTGDRKSQAESEKHTIDSITQDGDNAKIRLVKQLAYTHTGVSETYGDKTVDFRAEVGLLTRTILIRGNRNPDFTEKIEACADGFDIGEFAVQTCFQGRFGEELGSDQFGATIMVHQQRKDTQEAVAHIEYIEVTYAGQAFHLGRYPIHFHLNGNMSKSYVRGCAVHESFNRAVNLHDTHYTTVEHNVVYNIMGGAFFIEDGIETGNVFQYNLAIFVKASSSLLNDDITPAGYWVTNANNIVTHNHAAGGTHFGFWYRMNEHPDGPSYTPSICPRRVPLGVNNNNTVHSQGWFGLWTFQEWVPMRNGKCDASVDDTQAAAFEKLTVWNCDKGLEVVDSGAMQVKDSVFVNNEKSGVESIKWMFTPKRSDNSPMVKNSWLVGRTDNSDLWQASHGDSYTGVVVGFGGGFRLINVNFKNYEHDSSQGIHYAVRGLCPDKCGGYYMDTQGLVWHNVKYKGKFRWDFEGIIEDIDGTLTGTPNTLVTPMNDALPTSCNNFSDFNPALIAAAVCPGTLHFHRLAFNNVYPSSLDGKAVRLTNGNGIVSVPYAVKRFTHKEGWMATLVDGETYTIEFENAEHLTNISFTGMLSEMQEGYVEFKIRAYERPDRFSLDGGDSVIPISEHTTLARETAEHGQWTYDGTYVHFAMKGPSNSPGQYPDDISFSLLFYKCAFLDCVPPLPDDDLPLATERPPHYRFWDSWVTNNVWKTDENNPNHVISAARNYAGEAGVAPVEGNDVTIAKEDWIVLRKNHLGDNSGEIRLGTILLQGQLEVSDLSDDDADTDYKLFVNFIIIMSPGRLLFGWPDRAFDGKAEINLVGSINAQYYSNDNYHFANVGAKAIGVFGGLDLFGKDYGPSWTTLSATANSGDRTLQVDDDISSWPVDGNIFITATGFNPKETEKLQIESVSGQTITLKESLQYTHIGLVETVNGKDYKLAAAVGLTSHNIKVQADEIESNHVYGGRVIASVMQSKVDGSTHTGYARVENVEFNRMGQDGFIEEADPRFAFTALSTREVQPNKPFKVSKCSFSTSYNSAIGLFGTKNIELSDNVVFESLGDSIRIASSSGTKVTHNLVSNMLATASYNGREEEFNIRFEVGMNLLESKDTEFERNYVAASEKGGYLFSGVDCDSVCTYDDERSNIAASNSFGAVIFPDHVIDRDNCNKFCGLKLLNNFNYGFYYNNKNSVQISEMFIAGNQVGVFPMVTGPSSVGHICEHKTVEISNCVVLGHTSASACSEDNPPLGTWVDLMEHCKGIAGPGNEKIGLTFGQFSEGPNKAPKKPCAGIKKSDSICGSTKIKDVTLANFGPHPDSGCHQGSVAIATNPQNDDGQHPVSSEGITRINVAPDSDVQFHRPNIGKVTQADCVDMHCDGLLKNFVQDLDGTLLEMGPNGAVISDSGHGWNVDLPAGRGDYRIPIKMMTRLDGSKIDIAEIRDEIGIPRIKDNCRAVNDLKINAIKCSGTSYKMLSIESLDWDTMSRRLSPVAFSQVVAGDKYIDLLNGPQDHGCCAGYSCHRRLSLFKAIVAVDSEDESTRRRRATTTEKIVNEQVEVYLTSTPPERMRFLFVDPDDTSCIVIVFFFWRPYRVDVLRDDGKIYVAPKNAEVVKDRLKYNYEQLGSLPTCADDQGANYVDRDAHLIYFVLKGKDRIELKYREQVILSFNFPTLTPEEVFGIGIIENMAALLNVPEAKVRVVKIVAATGGRRKRSTGSDVEVEIGNEPSESDDESSQVDPTALAGEVMNSCQDNIISAALATDGVTCSSILVKEMTYTPVVPDRLEIYQELEPQHEGAVFLTQPKLRAYDSSGNVIQYLGIIENPWQMTATIRSNTGYSGAVLGGTVTVEADNGWFNFTDLSISHAGTGYIIDFDITMPTAAADLNLATETASFDVDALPLKAELYAMTSDTIVEDTEFSFTLELRDKTTDQPLEDIGWRGHVFDIECGLPFFNEMSTVSGILNKTFDEASGRAQFDAVALSGYGPTYLECTIVSTPAEFDFAFYQKVNVIGTSQVGLLRDTSEIIVMRFKEDFTMVLATDADVAQLDQMVLQYIAMTHPNIVIIDSTISEGSILITFTVEGSLADVKAMTGDLCTDIKNGKSFTLGSTTLTLDTFMTVDGQDYYGVSCGASDSADDGLHPGYIALIAVLAVVLLAVIIVLLVWKMKVRPKTQTHDNGKTVYLGRGVTDEGTFTSMKSRENTLYHSHVNVDLRATPTPAPVDKMLYGSEATNLAVPPRDTWPHSQRVSPTLSPRSSSPTSHDDRPMWRF